MGRPALTLPPVHAWSPRQAAYVDGPLQRRALEAVDIGRDDVETHAALRLLGVDLALERLPAAVDVERDIVRFTKQQRKIARAFIFQGLNGRCLLYTSPSP